MIASKPKRQGTKDVERFATVNARPLLPHPLPVTPRSQVSIRSRKVITRISLMNNSLGLTAIILLLAVSSLSAATHYVSLGSTNPTPPYTNWVTAATNIQQAMNVAATNDAVLVTNGVYPGGVTVTKPLTLLSVNGPQFTDIDGGGTNRCVSLTDGASLTGFTLTNGHLSVAGGGVSCTSTNAFLTNCVITGNWGAVCSGGGGAYRGTLYDCTLSDNYGDYGGGAAYSTLYNCTLTGNSAEEGGGANHCTLYNCTLSTNSANWDGGGAVGCTLSNCTLSTNWATADGGGANGCTLYNCTLTGNSANSDGGGAYGGTLYNCTLSGNSAEAGGGANRCTLYNCTLSTNSANWHGGGADGCMLYSCTLSTNWATADGGGAYGGTLYNCTLTGNRAATFGGGANGCTLYNCTLTGNSANSDGGGAFVSTLYNCTLAGNSANSDGGGAFMSTLYNCTLAGNSANSDGGGAFMSTLYNCTLTGNSAGWGGGAFTGRLYNCIVYFNTAPVGANYYPSSILNYCCTTPLPTNGVRNITNAPLFIDYTNGNLRLQSNSPCINAGNNAYVSTSTDLDGRPRIVGGTVDIGAYEFQPGVSGAFIGWLQQYALPTDGSADYADPDHDGLNNWHEWICGTNPTNALSALRLVSALPTSTNATVSWQSVAGVNYFLERSANLSSPFTLLASNIVGQASTTTYADTNGTGAGPFFYRVGVKSP